jgi:transposase
MTTSFLYHGFGLKGYTCKSVQYLERGTVCRIIPQKSQYKCKNCGSKDVTTRGSIDREFLTLPIGGREKVYFNALIPRFHCHSCGQLHYMKLNFADERKSYTNHLAVFVLLLFRFATISAIAELVGLSWGTVKEIVKNDYSKQFSKTDFRDVSKISIDEISVGKGHKYLTVVINAETGQPLYVGDGKGESALDDFWVMLGKRRAKKIKAVAIDMGKAYIAAVKKNLPNAAIVFDRFHVVKLVNETLDKIRRVEVAKASENNRGVITGTKYLLLSNSEDLSEDGKERIQKLLNLNTVLSTAYILKEDLRQIWNKDSLFQANKALSAWLETARSSDERLLVRLANTIEKHSYGILNWYKYPINSGRIEGINNKIKTLIKQAYGYRDQEFLKLLILAIVNGKTRMVFPVKHR